MYESDKHTVFGSNNQQKEERDHQGKGNGKMYEDDEAKWVRVSGRENRRPSADGSRFRGEDLDSRHRRPRHELTRNSIQDGRCRSSGFQGVRRERSRKDHFPYQERSKGRTYEGTMRSPQLSESVETVNLLPTACVTQRSLCVTYEFERKNKIDVSGI